MTSRPSPAAPTATQSARAARFDRIDADLLAAVDRLVRAYQFRDRQRVCYYDLSVHECYALQAVIRSEGMTQKELAAELFLDKSTTSRIVDALETKGYVARLFDPDDGRAHRLAASDAGRQLHGRIHRDLLRRQRRLTDDLPDDVRRAAAIVVGRLADAATAAFQS